jgi:hypothetical protein
MKIDETQSGQWHWLGHVACLRFQEIEIDLGRLYFCSCDQQYNLFKVSGNLILVIICTDTGILFYAYNHVALPYFI